MEDGTDSRWRIVKKDYFMQNNAKVNCAAFHADSNLLVVGFSNGLFGLYDLPGFNVIHMLRYIPDSRHPPLIFKTDRIKYFPEQYRPRNNK